MHGRRRWVGIRSLRVHQAHHTDRAFSRVFSIVSHRFPAQCYLIYNSKLNACLIAWWPGHTELEVFTPDASCEELWLHATGLHITKVTVNGTMRGRAEAVVETGTEIAPMLMTTTSLPPRLCVSAHVVSEHSHHSVPMQPPYTPFACDTAFRVLTLPVPHSTVSQTPRQSSPPRRRGSRCSPRAATRSCSRSRGRATRVSSRN